MTTSMKVALVQLNSRTDFVENMAAVRQSLERAGQLGADITALPELWTYLGPYDGYQGVAQTLTGPAVTMLREQARRYHMMVLGGSMIERHPHDVRRFYNTSVLIDREGEIVAQYRKLHLFDVNLVQGDRVEHHGESEYIVAGDAIVTAELEGVTFGLAVCYDLRFPELFRVLAQRGAQVMFLPAAFTMQTGRDHWEVLLRARAIENQCYVLAPAQVGSYPPGKQCYGRSMVVDPWGLVLAQAQDAPTVLVIDIDLTQVERVRTQIPCIQHRRPDVYHLDN